MAARSLKRYSADAGTYVNNTYTIFVPAVPTARALVGRAIIAAVSNVNVVVYLRVGGVRVVSALTLAPSETYEQTGIVVPAGQTVELYATDNSAATFTFFGEEVDN